MITFDDLERWAELEPGRVKNDGYLIDLGEVVIDLDDLPEIMWQPMIRWAVEQTLDARGMEWEKDLSEKAPWAVVVPGSSKYRSRRNLLAAYNKYLDQR